MVPSTEPGSSPKAPTRETAVPSPDERYELKFTCDVDQLASVYSWIHTNRAAFRVEYPDRVVNNVYYDTYDMECMRTNLIGVGHRYKTRLRWYGTDRESGRMLLEYKIRHGRVGTKMRYELAGEDLDDLKLERVRERLLERVDPEHCRMAGDFFTPILRNAYRRSYFVSMDGRIRLTVDQDQHFFDLRHETQVVSPAGHYSYPYYVIELKADQSDAGLLSEIVRDFPLSVMRNSKYLLGVSSLFRIPYI